MGFDAPSLLQRAIGLLARRDHSRVELARKLVRYVDRSDPSSEAQVDLVLNRLQHEGKLSDERFAVGFMRQKARRFGAARMRQELQSRGVSRELAQQAVGSLSLHGTEHERAHAIWQRRFPIPPTDAQQWAKQARFLTQRGFSGDIVRAVLQQVSPVGSRRTSVDGSLDAAEPMESD